MKAIEAKESGKIARKAVGVPTSPAKVNLTGICVATYKFIKFHKFQNLKSVLDFGIPKSEILIL